MNQQATTQQSKTKKPKVLFICKKRHIYSQKHKVPISSGLLNSARFVVDMLNSRGVEASLVDVVDNNGIDKEVTKYNPTHVIIEALWVVPEKFEVLTKLHPKVKWIIRLHSEIPFLANEGIAVEWLYAYAKYKNVRIASNSETSVSALTYMLNKPVMYLPNYYELTDTDKVACSDKGPIHIGCFGAIRPLKNQFMQALAAIEFGNSLHKTIHFHINATRVEGKGDPILKNIENLFANNPKHKLIKHEWLSHSEFVDVVKTMDIGMQVSYSETFNIVTADFVNNNIPVVVSPEIFWVADMFKADPNSLKGIISKLKFVWKSRKLKISKLNRLKLRMYNSNSVDAWLTYFK